MATMLTSSQEKLQRADRRSFSRREKVAAGRMRERRPNAHHTGRQFPLEQTPAKLLRHNLVLKRHFADLPRGRLEDANLDLDTPQRMRVGGSRFLFAGEAGVWWRAR